jgi:BASS family bile acid:Na+ symporter
MLGMGMTLRPADFVRVISKPAAVAAGLATQMIGLPLVAVALVLVFSLDRVSAMAVIALAACPGGASSNSLSFFAKGDVPLSITLTATNSLISFVTTPLVIAWGLLLVGASGVDVELPFWDTARQILFLVVLPVLGGMAVAWKLPRLAAGAARPLVYLGLALIVLPTLLLPLRGTGISADRFAYFALITGALNVAGMLLAWRLGCGAPHMAAAPHLDDRVRDPKLSTLHRHLERILQKRRDARGRRALPLLDATHLALRGFPPAPCGPEPELELASSGRVDPTYYQLYCSMGASVPGERNIDPT